MEANSKSDYKHLLDIKEGASMGSLDISSVPGPDGTKQFFVTDQSLGGKNGDDFRYIETRVGNVVFRPVRRGLEYISLLMIDGNGRRLGPWDEPKLWMDGSPTTLFEYSESATYAISPSEQWVYQARRIERGLSVATVYQPHGRHLDLIHFGGLRLDDYIVKAYLGSIGKPNIERSLYNRVIHFERWLPHDGLRVNIGLTLGEGDKKKEFSAFFEVDLLRKKLVRMVDISNVHGYNYQPNDH